MSDQPYAPFDAPISWMQTTGEPRAMLTISDVERLAKAGVKIEFDQIKAQIRPDPPGEDHSKWLRLPLVEAFWERWRRANLPNENTFGSVAPWGIYANEVGDTVYVLVMPRDAPPFIIEDTKHLYPSDALMAALHLYGKAK